MRVKKTLLTAEDLLHLPDTGCRLELVEGELLEMPPAGGMHGKATIRIGGLLDSYALDKGLGHTLARRPALYLAGTPIP
jgi:Uma2 family endonuclease